MQTYANMGPFKPVSFKGNAKVTGVPVFVDKLPLTIGGIAGEDIKFGRVVSIVPTANRREFVAGVREGGVIKGISMLDPTIMRVDPAQQDYYFAGRPMTATTIGILDIFEYDLAQEAPVEGSTVWCRNDDGILAFNDGTNIASLGYTKLNAFVYETYDPNGAKVAFGLQNLAVEQERETTSVPEVPEVTPASGAVAAGTKITMTCATPGAKIYYTTDSTIPTTMSNIYDSDDPPVITAAAFVRVVAVATNEWGLSDPSVIVERNYTIQG